MIPEPYGGRLVDRVVARDERSARLAELDRLPVLHPFVDQLYDLEKIAVGAYSPLEGFMGSADLEAVLSEGRLANGLPWSMPIVFAPNDPRDAASLERLREGDQIALADGSGERFATLTLSERFPLDRRRFAEAVYGTTETAHPNVADLYSGGEEALAGPVELVRPRSLPAGELELTPAEVREEFARRNWRSVAAYQCRNPPHTAHEYLQRLTLEREDVDGLFVHPVVGRLKKGDYRPDVILRAYQKLLSSYYPKDRVFLSSLSITMRYGGPKAALFLAIVRRNFGCSHYIVGRDQAGVAKYYDPYACHRIFDKYDIGVIPLRYEETHYCRKCGWMATPKTCAHPAEDRVATSQTRIRSALAAGEPLPTEIIRPEVADVLKGSESVLS
jgi:sulfate adenylyltransferase